jgi:hypothetical protein
MPIDTGSHSIQLPDGKFLIVTGGSKAVTAIYDPVANSFETGATLTADAGDGSLATQRPDNTFLITHGDDTDTTSIYVPGDNSTLAGPVLTDNASAGAHSLQLSDGRYLIVHGGGTESSIYDTDWNLTGTYESEIFENNQLDEKSLLSWTGNSDSYKSGAVSVAVRTASTSADISTASWRIIKKSGNLIYPEDGENFLQVRITLNRQVAMLPGAERNIWKGSGSTLYNRLPLTGTAAGIPATNLAQVFNNPLISGYSIMQADGADLATFSLNDENLFRFSSNGDAFTGGGSWNAGGADVAEYFPTNDATLEAGDIVTVAEGGEGLIRKSSEKYDESLLGIITTTPGVLLGIDIQGGTAGKQPVALIGRVPVKVSLQNGAIKRGDYITSSAIPGVGMLATAHGRSVAIALSSFDASDADANGMGEVLAYVNPQMYLGESVSEDDLLKLVASSTPYTTGVVDFMSTKIAEGVKILKEFVVAKVVAVIGYFDTVFTREIHVSEQLCIGTTCTDETQLRELLGLDPHPSATSTATTTDETATTTDDTDTSTNDGSVDDTSTTTDDGTDTATDDTNTTNDEVVTDDSATATEEEVEDDIATTTDDVTNDPDTADTSTSAGEEAASNNATTTNDGTDEEDTNDTSTDDVANNPDATNDDNATTTNDATNDDEVVVDDTSKETDTLDDDTSGNTNSTDETTATPT